MSIKTTLEVLSLHRDLVPAYFHRRTGLWIIKGTAKSNGGAVVVDDAGQIIRVCTTKCNAISFLDKSAAA